MTRPLEAVLADLAAVQDELLSAPADDFARRAELSSRQDELRAEADEARSTLPDDLTAEQLEEKIAHLEAQILRHLDSRPSASAGGPSGGYGGGGIDPDKLHEMQQKMAASFGLEDKQRELTKLKTRLSQLREA